MKKTIKAAQKKTSSSTSKKNTRPFTAKKSGYNEDVFNSEEQQTYEKSSLSKNEKNTAGPKL